MRFDGILRSWNDERGFGFIAPTQGGPEIFVHASALVRDGVRPTIGETLSYEVGKGKNGKPQAINVHRKAFGAPEARRRVTTRSTQRPRNYVSGFVTMALVVIAAAYAYSHYTSRIPKGVSGPVESSPQSPALQSDGTAAATGARCDGRKFCSQMTSCTEAKFFLKNSPGVQMDGNNDGVPCEQQWCTGRFAK